MIEGLPPFVLFFLGAVLVPFVPGLARYALLLALPVIGGLNLLTVPEGTAVHVHFLGYEFVPYRVDRLSLLFGYLFHLAAFLGIVFSLHVRDTLQHVMGLLYAGSGLGAVFAGDLITLFVFWELLAITSVFLIWARRTPRAMAAGRWCRTPNLASSDGVIRTHAEPERPKPHPPDRKAGEPWRKETEAHDGPEARDVAPAAGTARGATARCGWSTTSPRWTTTTTTAT